MKSTGKLISLIFTFFCSVMVSNGDPSNGSGYPQNATQLWNGLQSAIENDPLNVSTYHTGIADYSVTGITYPEITIKTIRYDLGTLNGTNPDGSAKTKSPKVSAFYAYPSNASATNKVPAIVNIHGGGQIPGALDTYLWASRGYAVISINWGGKNLGSTLDNSSGSTASVPLIDGLSLGVAGANYDNTDWDGLSAGFVRDASIGAAMNVTDPIVAAVHSTTEKLDPQTLADGATLFEHAPHPMNGSFILNSYAARRAITFLTQQAEVDATKIGVMGFSMGGVTTTITGSDPRITALAPSVGGTANDYENYYGLDFPGKALYLWQLPQFGLSSTPADEANLEWYRCTIGQEAYWPIIQVPTLFVNGTNDFNAPFDLVPRSIDMLPAGVKGLMQNTVHANHRLNGKAITANVLWMNEHLQGGAASPSEPASSLDLTHASGVPVFSVTPDQSTTNTVTGVEVYYGYDYFPLERYWHKAVAVETSPGTWEAACPVFDTSYPMIAYAEVTYQAPAAVNVNLYQFSDTFSLTSDVQFANAEDNGVNELTANGIVPDTSRSRDIDSGDEPFSDWFNYSNTNQGSIDIGNFKLGAPRYVGPAGASLAFDVTSNTAGGSLTLTLQEAWQNIATTTYSTTINIPSAGTSSFSIPMAQFLRLSDSAPMATWDNIELFSATGTGFAAGDLPTFSNVRWVGGTYPAGTNEPPAFTAKTFTKAGATSSTAYTGASVSADATDPEASAVTYEKIAGPAWLTVASDGTLGGTPTAGDVGDNKFIVMAKDAAGGTDFTEVEVTVTGPTTTSETTSTNELAYDGDVSNTDLLHGLSGTLSGFILNGTHINDGVHGRNFGVAGGIEGAYAAPGAIAEFNLGTGDNGLGYDISSIQSIASWSTTFANQAWTVEVKTVGGTWTTLDTVDYQPVADGAPSGATKVTLTDAPLATGVDAIRFTAASVAGTVNNGSFVWREVDVFGTSTAAATTKSVIYSEDFENSPDGVSDQGTSKYTIGWGGTSFTTTAFTLDVFTANGTYSSAVNNLPAANFEGGRFYGSMGTGQVATTDTGQTFVDGTTYDFSFLHYMAKNAPAGLGGGRALTAEIYDVNTSAVYASQTFPAVNDYDNPETRTLSYTADSTANGNNIGLRLTAGTTDHDDAGTPYDDNIFFSTAVDNIELCADITTPPPSGLNVNCEHNSTVELAFAGDVSSTDLLHGISPAQPGQLHPDPFNKYFTPTALNDGVHGASFDVNDITAVIASGTAPGAVADYRLGYGPNGTGYDVTSIQSIAAWAGAAFGNQAWTVDVKPVGADWYELASVDCQPLSLLDLGSTKVTLTDGSGTLATGIERIRFTADSIVNTVNSGSFQWREIDVFGAASPPEATPVAPTVVSFSPDTVIDGSICSNISPSTKLVAKFDEAIQLGTGAITIVNLDTNATTILNLPNSQVSIDAIEESHLVIEPSLPLDTGTRYAVQIDATVIDDKSGNSFAGISDSTTWTFTTRHVDPLKILCIGDSITVGYTEDFNADPYMSGYRSHLYHLLNDAGYVFQFVGGSVQPYGTSLGGDPTIGGTYKPEFDLRDLDQDYHQGGGGAPIGAIPGFLAGNDADLVLLKVGINSIQVDGAGNPVFTTATLQQNILDLAKAVLDTDPDVKLVIAQTIPYAPTQTAQNAQLLQYNLYIRNQLIPALNADGYDGTRVRTADMYSMFLEDPNDYLSAVAEERHSNNFNHPWNIAYEGAGYDVMAQKWFEQIETMGLKTDAYDCWVANTAFGLAVADQGFTEDPDGDGIANGVEAYFGTNPAEHSQGLCIGSMTGTGGTFSHPVNDPALSGLLPFYQWSTDLSPTGWYNSGQSDPNGLTVTATPVISNGTATVTTTASSSQTRIFFRLGVLEN